MHFDHRTDTRSIGRRKRAVKSACDQWPSRCRRGACHASLLDQPARIGVFRAAHFHAGAAAVAAAYDFLPACSFTADIAPATPLLVGAAWRRACARTGRNRRATMTAWSSPSPTTRMPRMALEAELAVFAGSDLEVLQFPDWETLPYDLFSPHPDIVSQRIATLYRLPTLKRGVLVVPVATLMQRLAPRSYIAGSAPGARAEAETRYRQRTAPARSRRLSQRAAGAGAGRFRGARRAARHLPDGQRRAVSHRAVRRRDRLDPHFRSGNAALRSQGRLGAPAARARIPADRGSRPRHSATRCANASRSTRAAARCTRTSRKA